MIHILFTKRKASALSIFLLLAASLACNGITSSSPGSSDQQPITITLDTNYGSGPFDLPDTKIGLSNLSGYKVIMTMTFDGTHDGKPEQWSKTYSMLATNNPKARQWTIERSGSSNTPVSGFMAEMSGIDYQRPGEQACTATPIQVGNTLTDRLEPASFLSAVIGADEAGSETVNQVAAKHYTFDQSALGEDGMTQSKGELWVASDGGYIVKYVLTRKGKADFFGEGIEGTSTSDYELTDPNQPVTIQLPDDCPPGFVDAPLLPDASKTDKFPGTVTYETSSSVADAAAFYEKNIPGLGWKAQDEPAISKAAALLTYQQGDHLMMIIIKPNEAKTQVRITVSKLQ